MEQTGNQGPARERGFSESSMELEPGLRNEADLLTTPSPSPASPGLWQLRGSGRVARDMCLDAHTLQGGQSSCTGPRTPQPTPTWTLQTWGSAIIPKPEWGQVVGDSGEPVGGGWSAREGPWFCSIAEQSPILSSFHQAGAALIQPVPRGCGCGGSGVLGQGSSCTKHRGGGWALCGSQLPWTLV